MITEKLLKKLGFVKTHVTREESGDMPYDYYTLEIGNDYEKLCLISNTDLKNIYIEFFNYNTIRIDDEDDLQILVEILKNNSQIYV